MCKVCESRRKLQDIEAMIRERENELVLLELMRESAKLELKIDELEKIMAEKGVIIC